MAQSRKTALIAGATGVTGRNQLRHLLEAGDWDVYAVSRRHPGIEGAYTHLGVDLLNPEDCAGKLATDMGITHIFYSAYVEKTSWAETVAPNLAMLVNLLDAVEPHNPLEHINLMQGSKWYGNHLGPFKTPAQESDPRHMPPNFYYDQQDHVVARQRGKAWSWSAARPHGICGLAIGNPMNLSMVVAVYASISKALGLPLRHPGSRANAHALYNVTDSRHLAKGVTWMATDPSCANEAFNITNGDIFRWEDMWPHIADYFELETAPAQKIDLAHMMADKGALWSELREQHGLRDIAWTGLVGWAYGNFVFTPEFDVCSSMTKARRAGFHDVVDSREMFMKLFDEFRAERIIP